jgi:hypothetical protein
MKLIPQQRCLLQVGPISWDVGFPAFLRVYYDGGADREKVVEFLADRVANAVMDSSVSSVESRREAFRHGERIVLNYTFQEYDSVIRTHVRMDVISQPSGGTIVLVGVADDNWIDDVHEILSSLSTARRAKDPGRSEEKR